MFRRYVPRRLPVFCTLTPRGASRLPRVFAPWGVHENRVLNPSNPVVGGQNPCKKRVFDRGCVDAEGPVVRKLLVK